LAASSGDGPRNCGCRSQGRVYAARGAATGTPLTTICRSWAIGFQLVLPCRTASSIEPSRILSNCWANVATAAYSVRNRIVSLFCRSSSGAVQTGEATSTWREAFHGVVRLDADPEVTLFQTRRLRDRDARPSHRGSRLRALETCDLSGNDNRSVRKVLRLRPNHADPFAAKAPDFAVAMIHPSGPHRLCRSPAILLCSFQNTLSNPSALNTMWLTRRRDGIASISRRLTSSPGCPLLRLADVLGNLCSWLFLTQSGINANSQRPAPVICTRRPGSHLPFPRPADGSF
jgi:hypothetical protein